jgi:uncharacterized protein
MRILITGSTGLVGTALVPHLRTGGHEVIPMTRRPSGAGGPAIVWDPAAGQLDPAALVGLDAIVHLSGESIASGRWSQAKKARIRESRVRSTELLASVIARLDHPPAVFLSASAIGFYGDRGAEILTEESPPGQDFLSRVCRDWEAASEPIARQGVRVVRLRFGMILSPAAGALAKMLPPFRLGAGGPIGGGRQFVSWIAIDDVLGAIVHAFEASSLSGPINIVSPRPVTSAEFARALGRALRRPALLTMPAVAARVVFGEMADALLLSSQRVEPKRLVSSGYRFLYPDLEPALRHLLGRTAA